VVCQLYHQGKRIGEPTVLTTEQLDEVAQAQGSYDQSEAGGVSVHRPAR
jgi:hypothetical protein